MIDSNDIPKFLTFKTLIHARKFLTSLWSLRIFKVVFVIRKYSGKKKKKRGKWFSNVDLSKKISKET